MEVSRGAAIVVSAQDRKLLSILLELEGVARTRYEKELSREGLEILLSGDTLARSFFHDEKVPLLPKCKCNRRTAFLTADGVPYCSKCNPRRERQCQER